jgi:hypothetical protein
MRLIQIRSKLLAVLDHDEAVKRPKEVWASVPHRPDAVLAIFRHRVSALVGGKHLIWCEEEGISECYLFCPHRGLATQVLETDVAEDHPRSVTWTSPGLGITIRTSPCVLEVYDPDGTILLSARNDADADGVAPIIVNGLPE